MRINRLHLTRYGRFTDHSLDFGDCSNGDDFHIVYGPNEAGKSTLRDAFLHFLYGIPVKTPYNFIHDYELLEIGASLTFGDSSHTFRRIKKRQNDLLDEDGAPVAPGILTAALGGIGLESYKTMFSLDDKTLKDGGESILASEGDLGQMLFSAASGLSGLGKQIEMLKAEAASFFKPAGRSFELAEKMKKLKELEQKIKDADINAGTYEKLVQTETNMREQYDSAKAQQDLDTAEIAKIETVLLLIPLWHQRKEITEKLAELANEPDLPNGWLTEARELERDHAGCEADFKHAKAALDKARAKHGNISVDEKIMTLAPDIERLTKDDFEARFRTSRDIIVRQKEVDDLDEVVSSLLQKLGQTDCSSPADLILPASSITSLTTLINERSVIDTLIKKAEQELVRANEDHLQTKRTHSKSAPSNDLSTFNELFKALSSDYPEADLQATSTNIARLEQDVRFAMHQLSPWQGTPEELFELAPPSKTLLEALKSRTVEIARVQSLGKNSLHEENAKIRELQAELDTSSTIAGVFDDKTAIKARAAREQAWVNHRVLLEAPLDENRQSEVLLSAENFETAMSDDDNITAERFHHTSELAALRQLQIELGKSRSKQATAQQAMDELQEDEKKLRGEIIQIMQALNLPANTPLLELERWLDKRTDAISKFKSLELERQNQSALATTASQKSKALANAMKAAGLPETKSDWTTATTIATQAIEDWKNTSREQKSADAALKTAQKQLKTRETEAANAIEEKRRWEQQWQETLRQCWIGQEHKQQPDDQLPAPAKVRHMLEILADLEQHIKKTDEIKSYIVKMQADHDNYVCEVKRIGELAEQAETSKTPLAVADALRARLTHAVANREERVKLANEIETEEKKHAITRQALDVLNTRFDEMAARFPADDFTGLLAKMERAHKKLELQEKKRHIETEIISRLGSGELAKAQAVLSDPAENETRRDELKSRLGSLQSAKKDTDQHVSHLYHQWKSAQDELAAIGGDAQVAKMQEEKRTLLLDLEAKTHRFLELSAGSMLLERALQKYRETHQSALMEQASNAFASITSGQFSGFQSISTGSREVLVGIRRDRSTIKVEEMSKGTRFQLYLSLRVAGHAEYAAHQPPLPFFADDILETFDDNRSTQTLSLLFEMARRGQVIVLTHHRHICDLARQTCGSSVTIHDLTSQPTTTERINMAEPQQAITKLKAC